LGLVYGFKRIWPHQKSLAINLHLVEYRTNSKLAKHFGRDDGGHESSVVNHKFNRGSEYHVDWYSDTNKPWLVLLTGRRNWLLHIEWKHVANHLCVLEN